VLNYLLNQKDVNADIKDLYGYTVLHMACKRINQLPIDIFKLLIEKHGADVNAQNNDKDTPLHDAFRCFVPNDDAYDEDDEDDKIPVLTVLTYVLSKMKVNADIKGKNGYSLLHYACEKINILPIDVFKALIETLDFDINAQDDNKNTPIHYALEYSEANWGGNITVLAYLINQKNINANIKDSKGFNLLHLVCISNLSASVELNAEYDSALYQIVEFIVERYTQEILDEITS